MTRKTRLTQSSKRTPKLSEPSIANYRSDPSKIAETQNLLNRLGYEAGPADGMMGRKTKSAILLYQSENELEINGEVSPLLIEHMQGKLPASRELLAPNSSSDKQYGKDDRVAEAQTLLTKLGYYNGPINNTLDNATGDALEAYSRDKKILHSRRRLTDNRLKLLRRDIDSLESAAAKQRETAKRRLSGSSVVAAAEFKGVRLGMPFDQARAIWERYGDNVYDSGVKWYGDKSNVRANQKDYDLSFETVENGLKVTYEAFANNRGAAMQRIVGMPQGPICDIKRTVNFGSKRLSVDAVNEGLIEKYGPPTARYGNGNDLCWGTCPASNRGKTLITSTDGRGLSYVAIDRDLCEQGKQEGQRWKKRKAATEEQERKNRTQELKGVL